jgi:hypothetical protein
MNVTQALSLEAIKGEAGATSRAGNRVESTSIETTTSTQMHHPLKETWDPLPSSKACDPYYEHSSARQHEQQQNPLDIGPFMPKPVSILVSALHTIRA